MAHLGGYVRSCLTIADSATKSRVEMIGRRADKKSPLLWQGAWCGVHRNYWFSIGNEVFFVLARKSRDCAEAYIGTPHKQAGRLTRPGRKRTVTDENYLPMVASSMITG